MSRLGAGVVAILLVVTMSAECQTMKLAWRYPTGGQIRSRPAVAPGGAVYALSEDGYLYAFHPAGGVEWATDVGGLVTDALSVGVDGTIYAGLLDDRLVAVNPRGRILWSFRASGPLIGDPAIASDGTVFAATTTGHFYSIGLNGRLQWDITLPARITFPPVLGVGDTIYLGGSDRRIYALTRWGSFRWSLPINDAAVSAAVGPNGSLYVVTAGGRLMKLSPAGTIEWQREMGKESFGPLLADRTVFVADPNGRVTAIGDNGKIVWKRTARVRPNGSWVIGEGRIYLMGRAKQLTILDIENGAEVGSVTVGSSGTLAIANGDHLYIGGKDWVVYAYRGAPADVQATWPQPSRDARHSRRGREGGVSSISEPSVELPDYLALSIQADSLSQADLMTLLGQLRSRFQAGGPGKSTWYVERILERLAGVGVLDPVIKGTTVVNNFPAVRMEAARLLGKIGSLRSRNLLIRLLGQETDAVAASQEIEALGEIGSDNDGKSAGAIAATVVRFQRGRSGPELRVARAAIDAIGRIVRYGGVMPKPAGPVALQAIYQGAYPIRIRLAALTLLQTDKP